MCLAKQPNRNRNHMKPTTEDFLIPMPDAIRLFVNIEDVDFVQSATRARIHVAMLAKMAHDEECQRLADQWVADHKAEFFHRAKEYTKALRSTAYSDEFKAGALSIWGGMRDKADPIFRDYISEWFPTEA